MSLAPTPYTDVNTLLEILLRDIRATLGEYFVGMYVHGSLALDAFVPDRSDIDIAVVMTEDLPDEVFAALAAMHERIKHSGIEWAEEIEATYFSQEAIRRHDITHTPHPYVGVEDAMVLGEDDHAGIIMRHILREYGLTVTGPDPKTLVDPVSANDLRRAVSHTFTEWWKPFVLTSALLEQDNYRAYAILTMCRMRYTLACGDVVSKSAAARWAISREAARWVEMIEWALAWPQGEPQVSREETEAFIWDTDARIQEVVSDR